MTDRRITRAIISVKWWEVREGLATWEEFWEIVRLQIAYWIEGIMERLKGLRG